MQEAMFEAGGGGAARRAKRSDVAIEKRIGNPREILKIGNAVCRWVLLLGIAFEAKAGCPCMPCQGIFPPWMSAAATCRWQCVYSNVAKFRCATPQ